MATTYVKGKLKKTSVVSGSTNTEIRLPATTLDNIYVYVSGTSITGPISLNNRINSAYLPSTVVYTTGGTIASTILPIIPAEKLSEVPASTITGVIKKENLPSSVDDITELKSVSASAPSATGVVVGDQYFDTTKGKVVTAVSAGTWTGGTESNPSSTAIYYVPSTNKGYRWSGSTMMEIALSLATTTEIRPLTADNSDDIATDDFVPTERAVRLAINAGGVSFATQSEVIQGTETGKVVSPATLQGKFNHHFLTLTSIGTTPSNPQIGNIYYNSSTRRFYQWKGDSWEDQGFNITGVYLYVFQSNVFQLDGENNLINVTQASLATDEYSGSVNVYPGSGTIGILAIDDNIPDDYHSVPSLKGTIDAINTRQKTIQVTQQYGLSWNSNTATLSLTLSAGYGITSVSGGTITADLEWQADS